MTLKAESLLPKFFVRSADTPRPFKLTFNDDGFYKSLKRKAIIRLNDLDRRPVLTSKVCVDVEFCRWIDQLKSNYILQIISDILVFCTFLSAILAVKYGSYCLAFISSVLLAWTVITSHNFFHQKDNFRMYWFNLLLLSFRDWRISHVISHHHFTNSYYDMEVSGTEPLLCWLPEQKSFVTRWLSWFYILVLYALLSGISYTHRYEMLSF